MEEKSRAVRSVESEETFNDYEFSPVPDEKKTPGRPRSLSGWALASA